VLVMCVPACGGSRIHERQGPCRSPIAPPATGQVDRYTYKEYENARRVRGGVVLISNGAIRVDTHALEYVPPRHRSSAVLRATEREEVDFMKRSIRLGPFTPLEDVFYPLCPVPHWAPRPTDFSCSDGDTVSVRTPSDQLARITVDHLSRRPRSIEVGARRIALSFDGTLTGDVAIALMGKTDPSLFPGFSVEAVSNW
jgi:hypothetical protein